MTPRNQTIRCSTLITYIGVAFIAGGFGGVAKIQADDLIIHNVTLIDGTGAPAKPASTVVVENGRIISVCSCVPKEQEGATVIDGSGQYLLPGLWDTHIHLEGGREGAVGTERKLVNDTETGIRMLHGYIYSGVTSVYDAGNHDEFIFGLRTAQRNGEIVSPRIFAAGRLVARPGGYAASGGGMLVDSYEEGIEKLDQLFADKPDLVKFIRTTRMVGQSEAELPTVPLDVLDRLIMYSNQRGFRTTVHAVDEGAAWEVVDIGIDALAHPVYMTPTDRSLATTIAAKGIPVSTTLVVLKNIARIADDPSFFNEPLFTATLNAGDLAHHRDAERQRYVSTGFSNWAEQAYDLAQANVQKLWKDGVILALGTDRTIGAMVHQELELLVETGIPPIEAIRIGTLNAAVYMNKDSELGSIETGKIADMIMVAQDPLADIRNTRLITHVFMDGAEIDRSTLADLPANAATP